MKINIVSMLCIGLAFSCAKLQADSENIEEHIKIAIDTGACPYELDNPAGIEINIIEPDYDSSGTLDTQNTLAEIRAIANTRTFSQASSVVAFADVAFSIGYSFESRSFKIPQQDIECHWVDKINFNFTFKKPPTILMPSELYEARVEDGGVCYDQIYAHEMQHIQDYERVFEEIVVKIDQDERLIPPQHIPSQFRSLEVQSDDSGSLSKSSDLLQDLIESHYAPVIQSTVKEIKSEMRYLGNLLDSTDEYQRITDLCSEMVDYIR